MSNQLTDLFDMTDTSDVPNAAIEAMLKLARPYSAAKGDIKADDVRRYAEEGCCLDYTIIAFARHIAREHPEWIEDPDLAAVREMYAADMEREGILTLAEDIRAKKLDGWGSMKIRLAAIKATRAAERAGQ